VKLLLYCGGMSFALGLAAPKSAKEYVWWCSAMSICFRLIGENALDVITFRIPEVILIVGLMDIITKWAREKASEYRERRVSRLVASSTATCNCVLDGEDMKLERVFLPASPDGSTGTATIFAGPSHRTINRCELALGHAGPHTSGGLKWQ
jgi:hypothetical protein